MGHRGQGASLEPPFLIQKKSGETLNERRPEGLGQPPGGVRGLGRKGPRGVRKQGQRSPRVSVVTIPQKDPYPGHGLGSLRPNQGPEYTYPQLGSQAFLVPSHPPGTRGGFFPPNQLAGKVRGVNRKTPFSELFEAFFPASWDFSEGARTW